MHLPILVNQPAESVVSSDVVDRVRDAVGKGSYAGRSQNALAASLGGGPQDAAQVHRLGGRGGLVPRGPAMDGGMRGWRPAGSAADRLSAAPGVVVGHRAVARLHHRPIGGGDGHDDPPAAARRARLGRERGQSASVGAGEPARADPPGTGHRAARHAATRGTSAVDYGQLGDVGRSWVGPAACGVGVRDGPALLAALVCAPDVGDGPGRVDRGACGGVRPAERLERRGRSLRRCTADALILTAPAR